MKHLAPLLALLACSCATIGPDYEQPEFAASETEWMEPADTAAIDPAWWNAFGDPLLALLVERAINNAPTVAEAEARIAEARANRAEVAGGTVPQVQASGSFTENRISENGQFPVDRIPGFPTEFSLFDMGFDASWEIDLWGQLDRAVETVDAQVLAAEAGRDDVLVSLSAEIARSYTRLRVAQAQAQAARSRLEARGKLAELAGLLADSGEGSAIEAENAAAAYEAEAAQVRLAEVQASAAAYQIAALMGEPPEDVVPTLLDPAAIPAAPDAIMVGVRSDLLARRPDIRQAERQLAAATAEIGFRQAELLPSFSLMGSLGLQARSLDSLFEGGSFRYSAGPSFSWPIFSGGRIRAQVAAADARAQAAAARYEGAVMTALADSEGAINRWLAARAAEEAMRAANQRQRRAFALAELRHEQGEDSRITLEQARLPLIASESALADAQGASAEAAIALYKALGGAWQAEFASAN